MTAGPTPEESVLFSESWQTFGHSALLPDEPPPAAAPATTAPARQPVARPAVAPTRRPLPAAASFASLTAAPLPPATPPPPEPALRTDLLEAPAQLLTQRPPRRPPRGAAQPQLWVAGAVVAAILAFATPLTALIVGVFGLMALRDRGASRVQRAVGLALTVLAVAGLLARGGF